MTPPLAVLCLHRVLPASRRNGPDEPYFLRQTALALEPFRALLDALERRDAVLSPGALLTLGEPDGWPARPGVVLTFDDGYADTLDHAVPELARRGMRALLCVTTAVASGDQRGFAVDHWYAALSGATARTGVLAGFGVDPWAFDLDRAADRARLIDGPEKRAFLRADADGQAVALDRLRRALAVTGEPHIPPTLDARALSAVSHAGWLLGAHGYSHALLPLLSEHDAADELARSRAFFSDHGLPAPSVLAYPDGATCPRTEALARAAGFTVGLALGSRAATRADPLLRLPRLIPTNAPDWFERRLLPVLTAAGR